MSPTACFTRSASLLCARVVQISALLLSLLFAPAHAQSLADPTPVREVAPIASAPIAMLDVSTLDAEIVPTVRGVYETHESYVTYEMSKNASSGRNAPSCPAPSSFQPKVQPEVQIQRITGSIRVDGDLSDAGWSDAARVNGFTEIQPGDQTAPSVCTNVWIGYDDTHLYVGFHAYDTPSEIRASLRNRDEIFQDDFVGILIDPFGDAAQAYEIFANPLGIQGDLLMRSNGEDIGFDIVYETDGQITSNGYVVEMAIPFSSLRFPDRDVQQWKTTFMRTRPRSNREQFSWSAVSRDDPCFMCQFGTMTGLDGIRPSTNLDILPAVVGRQSASSADDLSGLDNGRFSAEPSLNLRYGITPSLGAEVTVNPDFSQVESDAAQIDVNSTFALFFPERRPFFQEGSDLFQTPIDVVYTRSINAPIAAAKTTGRFGRTSVAVLGAVDTESPMLLPFAESSTIVDAGRSASNIVRLRQTFGGNSFAGVTLTDRRLMDADGSGTVASTDLGVQFLERYRLEAQFALSNTQEAADTDWTNGDETVEDVGTFGRAYTAALDGESYWGSASHVRLRRQARHYGFSLTGQQYTPTFRAPNGFVGRNDYRRIALWQGYTFYNDSGSGWLERIEPATFSFMEWDHAGGWQETYAQAQIWSRWRGQTSVFVSGGWGHEQFAGLRFDNLTNWNVNVNSNFSEPVRLGANVNGGRSIYRSDTPETGRRLNASVWATLQPLQRLVIQPRLSYASLRDRETGDFFFDGYIARVRSSVQMTRAFSARLVTQYNHFGGSVVVEPLVSYQLNPFTVFYVGSSHDYNVPGDLSTVPGDVNTPDTPMLNATSRQFFFKFQYLFRT